MLPSSLFIHPLLPHSQMHTRCLEQLVIVVIANLPAFLYINSFLIRGLKTDELHLFVSLKCEVHAGP